MFQNMENLKIINVLFGMSSISRAYSKRPYHGLVLKISGESFYTFSDECIAHGSGQVLYIPQGEAPYQVSKTSEGESRYALINFTASIDSPSRKLYTPGDTGEIRSIMEKMGKELVVNDLSSQYRCISLFYQLLSFLYTDSHRDYLPRDRSSLIEPAVAYLKDNLFDPGLRVEVLHGLCGISDTYFRRIFMAATGLTPKKYILDKRLAHAKHILDSGEYGYIYEVAAAVGFEDPLHFSKSFKNKYGDYPTRYGEPSGEKEQFPVDESSNL